MLAHEYDTMRLVEDRYWWYRVLRQMTVDEVACDFADRAKAHILDAGCGTGGTLDALRRRNPDWDLTGCDISALAIEHAQARGFEKLLACSVESIPVPDESQDTVTCLDVLYHEGVDEDRSMQEFRRVLRKGGRLVMNLPAFECLRGQHDVAVNGARRYTKKQVRELHSRNGFTVERVFCWNAWLFPVVWAWRQISKRLPSARTESAKSDLALPPEWLNSAVGAIAAADAKLCCFLGSPVGTSVFSVARVGKNP
jgi:ubiquinone/menaquinone biosynthesis C-methylase UbiE